jgi:hypothetical protein
MEGVVATGLESTVCDAVHISHNKGNPVGGSCQWYDLILAYNFIGVYRKVHHRPASRLQ